MDLAVRDDPDGGVEPCGNVQGPGEVVGGPERDHAEVDRPVGQAAGDQAHGPVPSADDQAVNPLVQEGVDRFR